jgi:hypothetical protein
MSGTDSIREMLTRLKFNWPAGRIVIRMPRDDDGDDHTFFASGYLRVDYSERRPLVDGVPESHPVLDVQIDTSYGSCNIPDMIAEDDAALYVVATYDGSSWLVRIEKSLDRYLEPGGPDLSSIGGG